MPTPTIGDLGMAGRRLCSLVEEVLNVALWAAGDPLLRGLVVTSVQPMRGVARLRVHVSPTTDEPLPETAPVRLERAHGYLRSEVARALSRKRVPALELVLLPPDVAHD